VAVGGLTDPPATDADADRNPTTPIPRSRSRHRGTTGGTSAELTDASRAVDVTSGDGRRSKHG
jgi:hypothetical protein